MNISVTQISKPIRLAFLIQPHSRVSFLRAIRISSWYWGGVYFPILTFHKKLSNNFRKEYRLGESQADYYQRTINNFDPDYIVVEEDLDQELVKRVIGDRTIVPFNEIEQSIKIDESKYGIGITDIISSLKETEFKFQRNDDLRISLPRVKKNDLLSATLFGSSSIECIQQLKSKFPSDKFLSFENVSSTDTSFYFNRNTLNFLRVGKYNLHTIGNPFWTSQTAVYIIDRTRLNDLINYWNLRALGWHIIAIPYDEYKNENYTKLIGLQQQKFSQRGSLFDRINVLKGTAVAEDKAYEITRHLNTIQSIPDKEISYTGHWWFPRFWMRQEYLSYDKSASIQLQSKVLNHTINTNDQQIRVSILTPDFGRKYVRHISPRIINEVIYEFDDIEVKYAQVIPRITSKQLDIAIKGAGFDQWRLSDKGMYFLATSKDEYLHFVIPTARVIMEKWFQESGFKIQYSSAGKLANQLLRNIGGIYGTNFLATPGILPILSLFENGKVVKAKTLFSALAKQRAHFRQQNLKDITASLLGKNIIQFGVELQCGICNQNAFYPLTDFQEVVKCSVCHSKFQPPSESPDNINWAYRGIGPYSRNNRSEGIVSILLTLRFFRIGLHTESITPMLNFEIIKDERVINEVDFALFYKKFKTGSAAPDLFLCECKTEIDFSQKDIDRMQKLGELFPGAILVFATLKKELSENEKELIRSLAKKFRKGYGSRPVNPLLILTGNELLSWLMWNEKIKHLIIPHEQFSDEIGHLCDVTTQFYLGLPSFPSEVQKKVESRIAKRQNEQPNA